MDATCDNGNNSIPFIIFFAISAGVNLVLVAVIILTCLLMRHQKKLVTILRYENCNNIVAKVCT